MVLKLMRECSGRCGNEIEYQTVQRHLDSKYDGHAPEIRVTEGAVSYAGGHLCPQCAAIVDQALSARRRKGVEKPAKWRASGMRWSKGGLRQ